jgi:hypothetical protein
MVICSSRDMRGLSERVNEHWEKNRGLHNMGLLLYTVIWCYLTKDSEWGGEIHKFQQGLVEFDACQTHVTGKSR